MTIKLILESGEEAVFARTEPAIGNFFAVAEGNNEDAALNTMRELIDDYLLHEGKDDAIWHPIDDAAEITFDLYYDIQTLFDKFKSLKISEVAHLSGMSASLLRQYVAGSKHPSAKQAKRIETAIRTLGQQLAAVSVC